MTTVEPTSDRDYIHAVLSHPEIFPHISDDATAGISLAEVAAVMKRPEFTFLRCRHGQKDAGLFMLHSHGLALTEVHTCILPEARGPGAYELARVCAQWIWANTETGCLTTLVPESSPHVLRFARTAGFREAALLPASLLRGGQYLNQHLLVMERPSCPQ